MYAIKRAVELAAQEQFSINLVKDIHATLCTGTPLDTIAGKIRSTQNWIGKGQNGPSPEDYVPPPAEQVEELLEDLCCFANRNDMPVVFQMAVTHAQFELIHPFGDGNGKVGRCLIHAVLARRLGPHISQSPISSVLATSPDTYISRCKNIEKETSTVTSRHFRKQSALLHGI